MKEEGQELFIDLVLQNRTNATLLDRLPRLELPDSYLVAGCLFQTVWNSLCGYAPTHGVLDYDVFYWDGSDLSWEAEDVMIRRCAGMTSDLDAKIQVRNQARVHLWYPEKYGVPYAPLRSTFEGIDTFPNGC